MQSDVKAQARKLQLEIDVRQATLEILKRPGHRPETADEREGGGDNLVAAPEMEAEGPFDADADGEEQAAMSTRPAPWRDPRARSAPTRGRQSSGRSTTAAAPTAIEGSSPRRASARGPCVRSWARSRLSPAPPRRSDATAPIRGKYRKRRTTCCGTSAGSTTSGRTRRTSSE